MEQVSFVTECITQNWAFCFDMAMRGERYRPRILLHAAVWVSSPSADRLVVVRFPSGARSLRFGYVASGLFLDLSAVQRAFTAPGRRCSDLRRVFLARAWPPSRPLATAAGSLRFGVCPVARATGWPPTCSRRHLPATRFPLLFRTPRVDGHGSTRLTVTPEPLVLELLAGQIDQSILTLAVPLTYYDRERQSDLLANRGRPASRRAKSNGQTISLKSAKGGHCGVHSEMNLRYVAPLERGMGNGRMEPIDYGGVLLRRWWLPSPWV